MAKAKKMPLRWAKGTKHPKTKKLVAGQIMSKEDRARYTTKGLLRKGAKKAPAKRKNPVKRAAKKAVRKTTKKAPAKKVVKKTPASKIKVAQTRKTAPRGWKTTMGPYAILTAKGTVIKGGTFRSLATAKKALAGLRDKGRKGLKLVKISIPKKVTQKAPAKKAPAKKRPARKNPRSKAKRKSTSRRKKSYEALLKRLGV